MWPFARKVKTLEHSTFGSLVFRQPGYWTGVACFFAPLNRTISVTITAGEEGPSPEQVAFFCLLTERFRGWNAQINAFLASECDLANDQVENRLALEFLSITNSILNHPQHWRLGFVDSTDPGDHIVEVEMNGERPTAVFVDG